MTASDEGRTITLWTAQAPIVIETLDRDGRYCVKRSYVDQKYGEVAWIFRQAYDYYARTAPSLVPRPEGAESGIWCFRDSSWAASSPGQTLLRLEVPRDKVVLFDLRMWNRMLNLQYLPKDREDERRFRKVLSDQGIGDTSKIFSTNFYPLLKREILASWDRLYPSAKSCDEKYLEAGLWEIRAEWIRARLEFSYDLTPYGKGQ